MGLYSEAFARRDAGLEYAASPFGHAILRTMGDPAVDALRIGRYVLGPLELSVLELLWDRGRPLTVRDVKREFPALAYTTVMTTLDRLFRKRLLVRHRRGRAFHYDTRCSRDELMGHLLSGRLTDLLSGGTGTATAVLSTLVRAVSSKDAALLDELEALVRAECARLNGEGK